MGLGQSQMSFIDLLTQLEANSTFKKNKHFGTAFEDIINYIITNKCSSNINNLLGSNSSYRQLPSNTKGIDGIITVGAYRIGVQIKFSKNIDKALCCSKKQFNPCLEVCKQQGLRNILIITNRYSISATLRTFFEKEGIQYFEFVREDFGKIAPSHVDKILHLKSVNNLITDKSTCVLL
jgi:hypothetical protein